MATKAQVTAEQYLHMTFEHDAEFVHGAIVGRALPDNTHSLIQFLILMAIGRLIQSHPLFARLLVIEILSEDDRDRNLMVNLEEYRVWGVPNIWVVDPLSKRLSIYTERGLQNVSSLALPGYPLELTPAVLFSDL